MQIKAARQEFFTREIRCDRCGRQAAMGDLEFEEMVCVESRAGYGSVFGDGNLIQIDLCQHCLKSTLGSWLRIHRPAETDELLAERLRRFDPSRHGGEFPAGDGIAPTVLDDKPVQGGQIRETDRPDRAGGLSNAVSKACGLLGQDERQRWESAIAQELRALASDVFSTIAEAEGWLERPHPLLGGQTPLEMARTPSGKQQVIDLLVATRYGGCA